VVLDQSLLQETDEEEVSQGGKPRPGARGARRRTTSTGLPAVSPRPQSSPRMVPVPSRNKAEDVAREITKRTAMPQRPKRSWVWLAVGLGLLLGGSVGSFLFLRQQRQLELVKTPAPRPVSPSGNKAASPPPPPSAPAREPSELAPVVQEPSSPPDSEGAAVKESGSAGGPDTTAAVPGTMAADAGTSETEDAGTSEMGDAGTPAAAPEGALAVAPDKEPDTASQEGTPAPELPMPAPLSSESNKRSSLRGGKRTNTSSRASQSMLQKEWARTRTAYKALTRIHACENLEFLCSRYENLEAEVVGMGDVESAELLSKVKALYRDIQRKKNDS
jgi:serine/threonine-protein kinase